MKVVILTSSLHGTAAHHLPFLLKESGIKITMVIYSEGLVKNKKKWYLAKLNKIVQIGFLGALNGRQIRKWYTSNLKQYAQIENLQSICQRADIPFYKTSTINSEETIALFNRAQADIGISLGNGYISQKIFNIPKHGMLNIHHALLPQYQNAQSIIWSIYNEEKETGFTIHKINRYIDKGEIVLQEKMPILIRDTLADTVTYNYVNLLNQSALALVKLLMNFEMYFQKAYPQGNGKSYTTPSYWQFWKMNKIFDKLKNAVIIK